MLEPLKQWICDSCSQVIESPEQGWLEWLWDQDDDRKAHGFKIVHHAMYSPRKSTRGCYHYDDSVRRADDYLNGYVGKDNLPALLAFLDPGEVIASTYHGPDLKDMREFVEIIRRLHVPYYEEARLYWGI